MLIERKSILSGKVNTMDIPVTQEELDNYKNSNILIQEAFPNLTPEQREFIKTGITPGEWDNLFSDEIEDE